MLSVKNISDENVLSKNPPQISMSYERGRISLLCIQNVIKLYYVAW